MLLPLSGDAGKRNCWEERIVVISLLAIWKQYHKRDTQYSGPILMASKLLISTRGKLKIGRPDAPRIRNWLDTNPSYSV